MKQLTTIDQMIKLRKEWPGRVGFVPTMGALHQGHLALIERARRECDTVVVSLFVNPTQFNDPTDFVNYPTPLEQDLALLKRAKIDYVFLPKSEDLYPDGFHYSVHENQISLALCGAHRPGHFTGMLTVVLKLLQLVEPGQAYFGEKDFQQLQLVTGMAKAFFLKTEIVPCPTVRESDGLALSSRNVRLAPEERERAPYLYKTLKTAPDVESATQRLMAAGFEVEYVEERWGRRLAAVRLGQVRLIDNVEL